MQFECGIMENATTRSNTTHLQIACRGAADQSRVLVRGRLCDLSVCGGHSRIRVDRKNRTQADSTHVSFHQNLRRVRISSCS